MKLYRIKCGDTLSRIAKRFNLRVDALMFANPQIKNPDAIYADQLIYIPEMVL